MLPRRYLVDIGRVVSSSRLCQRGEEGEELFSLSLSLSLLSISWSGGGGCGGGGGGGGCGLSSLPFFFGDSPPP